MREKHAPPIRCRIRRALTGGSPSAATARCTLGLRHGCPGCNGCTENIQEVMHEGFMAGLEEGKKNPLFRIDEEGNVHMMRDYTPEELETLARFYDIVDRAFPGYFDKED